MPIRKEKSKHKLHKRNKHNGDYDFEELAKSYSPLKEFVKLNDYGNYSIDFFKPEAVRALNSALLIHFYQLDFWEIPKAYLCPPIPGRADYIHYVADLLSNNNPEKIPKGKQIRCLDIGVGANCAYPIIGHMEYGWSFVGSEIDSISIKSAKAIITKNKSLKGNIKIRLQNETNAIFRGIIQKEEFFDITICNPPFHKSKEEALETAKRKLSKLKQKKITKPTLNFGGQSNELWCQGGEKQFIRKMILESKEYATSCGWFTTLVSKESNLIGLCKTLKETQATHVKTIPMEQGNKKSRILAWKY